MSAHTSDPSTSILRQPRAVWAVAFACVIAFMGIGLVDPILPAISHDLGATEAQTMLLFTSYLLVTGLAMFFTSFVSSRIGAKKTLLIGLALIVVFAALAGASNSVGMIIGFRAGWGLGNALFISTALATIVGAASGGADSAIILYEAALGLGIAIGPLVGGALGAISWRGPFFGTAVLMAIGLVALLVLLGKPSREADAGPRLGDLPRAAQSRPADPRPDRTLLQLRLLQPARLEPLPARGCRPRRRVRDFRGAPARSGLLCLGHRTRRHVGLRGARLDPPVRSAPHAVRDAARARRLDGRARHQRGQPVGADRRDRRRRPVPRRDEHRAHRVGDAGDRSTALGRVVDLLRRPVRRRLDRPCRWPASSRPRSVPGRRTGWAAPDCSSPSGSCSPAGGTSLRSTATSSEESYDEAMALTAADS